MHSDQYTNQSKLPVHVNISLLQCFVSLEIWNFIAIYVEKQTILVTTWSSQVAKAGFPKKEGNPLQERDFNQSWYLNWNGIVVCTLI